MHVSVLWILSTSPAALPNYFEDSSIYLKIRMTERQRQRGTPSFLSPHRAAKATAGAATASSQGLILGFLVSARGLKSWIIFLWIPKHIGT